MTKWTPQVGQLVIPQQILSEERTVSRAVLNLPEVGAHVKAELQGWVVDGIVKFNLPEYSSFSIEHKAWIDGHYRGAVSITIDTRLGWDIEIVDEA